MARAPPSRFGASPRASLALYQAGRALAWLRGRDYVGPPPSCGNSPPKCSATASASPTYEAEAEEITPDKTVAKIVQTTPVPAGKG